MVHLLLSQSERFSKAILLPSSSNDSAGRVGVSRASDSVGRLSDFADRISSRQVSDL
jgi:hypothetical protein